MAAPSPQEVFARVCVVLLEEDPGGWTAHGRVPVEAPLGPQLWAAVSRLSEQSLHTQVSAPLPGAGGSCWAGRCRVRFVEVGAAPAVCAGPILAPSLGWTAPCVFCGGGGCACGVCGPRLGTLAGLGSAVSVLWWRGAAPAGSAGPVSVPSPARGGRAPSLECLQCSQSPPDARTRVRGGVGVKGAAGGHVHGRQWFRSLVALLNCCLC